MIRIKDNNDCFYVKNSFVDKYICEAHGSFIKVYLYLLRHSYKQNLEISDIANAFNLLESDVIRAFKYWQKQGLIKYSQLSEKDFDICICDENAIMDEGIEEKPEKNIEKPQVKPASAPTGVNYTKGDINTYMKNNDGIRHMFLISETLLSKTLTETDRKILFSFYDYLGMPVEVIFTLLEYCISIGKSNMRYIEKVAYTWADAGINTLAKASSRVKQENEIYNTYKKYKTLFKISGREFTPTEEEFIKDWVFNLKLDDKTICAAYEKAVANTGKISFKYMDAILKNNSQPVSFSSKNTSYVNEKKNYFQDYDNEVSDFEREMFKKRLNRE